jgi:anti-sigma factor RsiW
MTGGRRACSSDPAPFVLGALEPGDARAFARHLESCAACRDEVASLAPAVDALPLSAPRYEVSAALRRRVMQQVRSEPKRSSAPPPRAPSWSLRAAPVLQRPVLRRTALRRPALAGALGLVVAAAALAGIGVIGTTGSRARVIQAIVGRAELRIAAGHGELVIHHLVPAPTNRTYELWLQRGIRAPAPSTLFGVTSRGTADMGLSGTLSGVTCVLVIVEPTGGSRAPTTPAVIVARLT